MMKIYLSTIVTIIIFVLPMRLTYSQNFDPIFIPFEVDGKQLQNPLIGGLTSPQFEQFDLDGQGAIDLIVFERNGNVILPFINLSTPGNPNYLYAPLYTQSFPDLKSFVKFVDFNNDGKRDIFTQSQKWSGIEVWINTSHSDEISFELMKFNFGVGNLLQISSGGNFMNLYMSFGDIPAIIDTDMDGDLDILTFSTGGFSVSLYQNMVKEMNLQDDTLVYRLTDDCWGNFSAIWSDSVISLSESRDTCADIYQAVHTSNTSRHGGSTITVFDNDGDKDLDMLLGYFSINNLIFLENDEIDGDPFVINYDNNFPSHSEPVSINTFLGSYYLDIDNDGKRDLIVCPNNNYDADNINHIWYYNNVGEDDAPVFELMQKDFLVETSLQMGTSSHPCFIDYNADGLLDLLVGMNYTVGNGQLETISLYLYENVGTINQPSYKLVDDDYLELKHELDEFHGFLAPAAGDLDGDGDTDILIGDHKSFLFYFENMAGKGQPYEFEGYVYEYKGLRVGTNGKPAIIDLDGDGLNDIVMGEKYDNANPITEVRGGLNFFKNIGDIGSPDFNKEVRTFPNTDILGQVWTKTLTDISSESSPHFFYDGGVLKLAVGSQGGNIYVYDDIAGNIYGEFNLVSSKLPILNTGRRTSVALEDIDNDGFHEMLVGNDNGGLMAFNTTFKTGDPLNVKENAFTSLKIRPNPTSDIIKAEIDGDVGERFSIINTHGQTVLQDQIQELNTGVSIGHLSSGFYIISLETRSGFVAEKFVKL